MINKVQMLIIIAAALTIVACSESSDTASNQSMNAMTARQGMAMARWYDTQQVENGHKIFQTYCAECHQPDASGAANWRQPDATGKYPPPPLNGTAHAWHHPLDGLRRTVRIGGIPLGGSMPAFSDKLNAKEIDDVLAWVQSNWSDDIYAAWSQRNKQFSR